jgi:hypothetical protein
MSESSAYINDLLEEDDDDDEDDDDLEGDDEKEEEEALVKRESSKVFTGMYRIKYRVQKLHFFLKFVTGTNYIYRFF